MADQLDPKARSSLMARIKGKDTRPEMLVRRAAHAMGYRFRLHRRDLPGTPDLVFPSKRKVLFVHGCFWHRHEGCRRATTPSTRAELWHAKFSRNMARDAANEDALKKLGWSVGVLWECQTKSDPELRSRLAAFLDAVND